ncbi:lysosomal alpha-glucosidase-like [Lingula anatina]|uniref:Lysosomal alpha-glucosidase-like n=1 Tax=Lingula anatina TaxID=7574 RepID=A0A1S3JBI5_LINAN|nr:lysosomal alpha-glucosidase-like [Lingula anatina]|eukprot:XP_013407693.1 lysosomal alpha-glucosidase-like [Lingula anatina]
MRDHLDWTYDPKQYGDLPGIVQDLHAHGQHYVMIVDPGISNQQPKGTYPPYEDGLAQQVFIMNEKGNAPLEGVVWPGKTVYPDFTNPATQDYWFYQASLFHQRVAFDGLWTDMNEPSDFVAGSTTGCEANNLTNPPYIPKILDGKLAAKTICPGAQQNLSIHYNLHSMYGHFEVIATQKALQKIRKKRSLVITRSSFPGTGHFGGHWSGDNQALWSHLYYSIPFILNFQMFGISQVGSDICGFIGETTEELCTRWMQVGAFYPFMRNHNTIGTKDQDPAVFSSGAQDAMREALVIRYTLLPYLNTLFYHSHIEGTGVVQPLMYMYPKDTQTYAIDKQFMWGSGLMISPVLDQGQTEVRAYFPDDTWYDYYTGEPVPGGHTILLSAPLEKINLHVRGATIIPTQPPGGATTTTYARMQPFSLIVALIEVGYANGDLYWDDGESLDAVENGKYTYITFQGSLRPNQIKSTVVKAGYAPSAGMKLGSVKVMGVPAPPGDVTINGVKAMFKYNENAKMLDITNLNWDLMKPFTIIFN